MDLEDLSDFLGEASYKIGIAGVSLCLVFLLFLLFSILINPMIAFLGKLANTAPLFQIKINMKSDIVRWILTLSLWLSTFIIPGFASLSKVRLQAQTINQRSDIAKYLVLSFLVILPIISGGAGLLSRYTSLEKAPLLLLIKYYSLILNIALAISFIIQYDFDDDLFTKYYIIALVPFSVGAMIILWVVPYFSGVKQLTYLLTSTTASLFGISKASG